MEPTAEQASPTRAGWRFVELAGTSGLAVAQPVLDIYSRNTFEFIARGVDGWELVAFAALVLIAPATIALAVEQVVGVWSVSGREALHRFLVTVFVGLFVLQLVPPGPAGLLAITAAGLTSFLFWTAWRRSEAARHWVRFLVVAPVAFGALFLTNADVWPLVVLDPPSPVEASPADGRPSVLFVIFDELPSASLLDADGRIDADRYPSFARLADRSTWYPNHTTIASWTSSAVPAALTGIYPETPSNKAHWTTHPQNLFRLLGSSHRIVAQETATELCPPTVCPTEDSSGSIVAMARAAADTWFDVASPYAEPQIDFDLVGGGIPKDESAQALTGAAEAIVESTEPVLSYVHVSLPHQAWTYLPSGATYDAPSPPAGRVDGSWADPMAAGAARQRHLLQLEHADRLFGEVLDRLEEGDALDDTVIVVMGDHGVAFTPGADHRATATENLEQIAYTPLFIKAPGQQTGVIDESFVQTVDIVPTVAELVDVEIPWTVDGVALGATEVPADRRPRFYPLWLDDLPSPEDGERFITFDREPLVDRLRRTGLRPGSEAVWQLGTETALSDRSVSAYPIAEQGTVSAEVHRGAGEVPAYVDIELSEPVDAELAVAVDGEIVLVGATGGAEGDRLWAVLPERAATAEAPLEVYLVRPSGGEVTLEPVEVRSGA